jgi:hypothetical protein
MNYYTQNIKFVKHKIADDITESPAINRRAAQPPPLKRASKPACSKPGLPGVALSPGVYARCAAHPAASHACRSQSATSSSRSALLHSSRWWMNLPFAGSTICFQRDEASRAGSATLSTSVAAGLRRYCPGIHAQANARRRRNATWLFVARAVAGPTDATRACSASKSCRAASFPAKYSSSVSSGLFARG